MDKYVKNRSICERGLSILKVVSWLLLYVSPWKLHWILHIYVWICWQKIMTDVIFIFYYRLRTTISVQKGQTRSQIWSAEKTWTHCDWLTASLTHANIICPAYFYTTQTSLSPSKKIVSIVVELEKLQHWLLGALFWSYFFLVFGICVPFSEN